MLRNAQHRSHPTKAETATTGDVGNPSSQCCRWLSLSSSDKAKPERGAEERASSSQVKNNAQDSEYCRINLLTDFLCRLEKPLAPAFSLPNPKPGAVLQTLYLWGYRAQESIFPYLISQMSSSHASLIYASINKCLALLPRPGATGWAGITLSTLAKRKRLSSPLSLLGCFQTQQRQAPQLLSAINTSTKVHKCQQKGCLPPPWRPIVTLPARVGCLLERG